MKQQLVGQLPVFHDEFSSVSNAQVSPVEHLQLESDSIVNVYNVSDFIMHLLKHVGYFFPGTIVGIHLKT